MLDFSQIEKYKKEFIDLKARVNNLEFNLTNLQNDLKANIAEMRKAIELMTNAIKQEEK